MGRGDGRLKAQPMKYRPAIGSTARARLLRSDPTEAEKAMWRLLRESFPRLDFAGRFRSAALSWTSQAIVLA